MSSSVEAVFLPLRINAAKPPYSPGEVGAHAIRLFFLPYSPNCAEQEFCEVRSSKRPIEHSGRRSTTAWWHRFGLRTRRLRSSRCSFVYQGVATRNGANARENLAPRAEARPNFAS